MAPSFLSKLVRAASPSHSRDRSDRSDRSIESNVSPPPKPRSRVQSAAATPSASVILQVPPTPSIKADINLNSRSEENRIPSFITTSADGVASDSSSIYPSVTVVPPSPRVTDEELSATSSSQSLVDPSESRQTIDRGRTISKDTLAFNEDNLPTPTVVRPKSVSRARSASKPRSRPLTPSISNSNLKEAPKKSQEPPKEQKESPPPMPSKKLEPTNEVRKRSSNKSLNPPPPISVPLSRAATTPEPRHEPTNTQEEPQEGKPSSPPTLVESPTAMGLPDYPTPPPSLVHAATVPAGGSNFLTTLSPQDSDSVSIISTNGRNGQPQEKKRPWRKSTTRKPTGLAGAIAASGMAMANHSLTAAQQAQFAAAAAAAAAAVANTSPPPSVTPARKSSNPGSPPYMSSSRNGSSRHVKAKSTELSSSTKSKRSRRRTGTSVASDNTSEPHDDRPEYYSGLEEGSSDEDDSGSEDDLMDLDLGEEDFPVTGFAVASNKRNADFHELFPSVPEGDYLIDDYGCALQREILIQGRIYISENHICFHANIFGWITDLSIPINEITHLEKRMTAFVIPNGIQITTRQAKYTFASFLSRDTTYDVIYNIWRLERPDDASIISGARGSFDHSMEQMVGSDLSGIHGGLQPLAKKHTQCSCGREGKHFSETALETVLPGTPDKIHNLIFASGFIKEFMAVNQKLLEIQMSDWAPTAPDSKLLFRNMSYIKPLNGSLGPKQTKCEIKDEMLHCDFDDYVVTLTTTRTPDVPSGGVFAVKTRTCIMFASAVSTRIVVTTQVEWTGRSFIKGIIERSAIDGQKVYHADLETSMRAYIQAHQSEFIPAGIDPAAITLVESVETAEDIAKVEPSIVDERKQREHERNTRALQWAWDTFDGAYHVAKQSTKGAIELIKDAWEQSSSTTILIFVIVILVISNLWTLTRIGSRAEAGRRREMMKAEEREKFMQGVVSALGAVKGLDQVVIGGLQPTQAPRSMDWREEILELLKTLDAVEDRVRVIRGNLNTIAEGDTRTLD